MAHVKKTLWLAVAFSSASTHALSQEATPVDLGTLVLRGDKISRTADEVAPGTSIVTGFDNERSGAATVSSAINSLPNVLADEDATIPTVRGISSTFNTNQVFGSGVLPRVPILVDNVASPVAQSSGYLSNSAWDVGTIEVARGPQPTSTGRNAFSGAIRVFTNDPIFDSEYAFRLGASSLRDGMSAAFMLNEQIIQDQLAIRIAGDMRVSDTLVRVNDPNVVGVDVNELEYRNLRTKVLYAPESLPGFELKFTYDHKTSRDQYAPVIGAGNKLNQLSIDNFILQGSYDVTEREQLILDGSYEFSEGNTLFFRASQSDNTLENPFIGSLARAGFREFGALKFDNNETEFETYLQFADVGPITKGVIGIIHTDTTEVVDNDPSGLSSVFVIDVDGTSSTSAIYGEIEWDLGQVAGLGGLTLITGGRFERDKRTRRVFADTNLQTSRTFEEDIFLPKVGLRYEPNDTVEIGYTYSEAYRPGGAEVDLVSGFVFPIGAPNALGVSPFEKETIKNHELHFKASLLEDRLNLGGTLFYYEYNDAQVPGASAVASAFPGFFLTGNIPEAVGKGLELTADYQTDNGWGFNTNLGWLDTKITNAGSIAKAFQGSELPNAPRFSGSLGVNYEHASGWDASLGLRYVGEMNTTLGGAKLDDYMIVDLAAGYDFESFNNSNLRLDVFVNNVADKGYLVENTDGRNVVGRPREIGINLTARF